MVRSREEKAAKKNITWVILTWNSQSVIEPCLKSVLQNKSAYNRIIVVDNGSSDGTRTLVRQIGEGSAQGGHIELIELDKNYGTTVSRNKALRMVADDCDYICILDSDTIVNQAAVEQLTSYLDGDPRCGIVGPSMTSSSGVKQPSGRNIPTARIKLYKAVPIRRLQRKGEAMEVPAGVNSQTPYEVGYLMSACWMMRPTLISEVGMLDENIFYAPEDVEYCIRVWKRGYKVMLCPGATIIHEWQRVSRQKLFSGINWLHIKGLAYMFRKHRCFMDTKHIFADRENWQ